MGKGQRIGVLALFIILMTGCANIKPMEPKASTKSLEITKESLVLLTLDIYRPDESRYIPFPKNVRIQKAHISGGEGKAAFQVDSDAGRAESESHNKFLFRMMLEPGDYTLTTIDGIATAFPFIGGFDIPVLLNFSVPKDKVLYIGDIEATLRSRNDSELRAGPMIPLIDQAVTGISGGTFDVTIKDASTNDIPKYESIFPVLKSLDIQKVILPSWNRNRAQKWWENDRKFQYEESTPAEIAAIARTQDGQVTQQPKKIELDVTKQQNIEFLFTFPSIELATRVANALNLHGFIAKVQASDEGNNFSVIAQKSFIPTEATLSGFRLLFIDMANAEHGQYDSWQLPKTQ